MTTTGISRLDGRTKVLERPGGCGRVQRLPPVHSQRESRPPMTCARSSASRAAVKE